MNRKATNITLNFKNSSSIANIKDNLAYQACIAGKVLPAHCLNNRANTSTVRKFSGNKSKPVINTTSIKPIINTTSSLNSKKVSKLITLTQKKKSSKINKTLQFDDEVQSYIDYESEKKYFQAPFENLREHLKDEPYLTQVSVAIIMQAMIDCTAHGEGKYTKKIRKDAREWIFGNSSSFKQTCIEAKILPEFVINKTKELIGITDPTRPSNQNLDLSNNIKKNDFYQYKMKQSCK